MEKLFFVVMFAFIVFCLGGFTGQQIEKAPHAEHQKAHAIVQQTCDLSRTGDYVTEQQCADVQYNFKIEYLCGKADDLKSLDRKCWTEDNLELEAF